MRESRRLRERREQEWQWAHLVDAAVVVVGELGFHCKQEVDPEDEKGGGIGGHKGGPGEGGRPGHAHPRGSGGTAAGRRDLGCPSSNMVSPVFQLQSTAITKTGNARAAISCQLMRAIKLPRHPPEACGEEEAAQAAR